MPKMKRKGVYIRRDVNADESVIKPYITVSDALERVMNVYITEGYRDRTMNDYRKYWQEFIDTIAFMPSDNVADITVDHIRKYIADLLKKRGLSPVTVNIRLGGVRAIFNRMLAEEIINDNPTAKVRKLKTDEQRIFTLTDAQVRRLFNAVDRETFAGYRDYVAMLTMLKCGLRANEVRSLELSDVDLDNCVILLPGAKNKNRKTRTVPITKKVSDEMRQLIAETIQYFGKDITNVFTNQFGEPMRDDHLRKRMDKYSRAAGLKEEVRASPHSLRHTFAVNFLKNSGDIRTLQMILGHSDLATTQIYLDYTDERISEQYRKVSENDTLDV